MDSLITEVTNWEDLRKNGTRIAQTVLKLEKNEQHTETKAKNRHKTARLGQVSWLKHVRFCLHTSLKKLKVFLLNEKKCNTLVPQIFRPLRWGEVWIADFPLLFFGVDLVHARSSSTGINTEVKYVHVVLFSVFHWSPWKEISVVKAQEQNSWAGCPVLNSAKFSSWIWTSWWALVLYL